MTDTSPPPEAQRFGRSQTPESPRPVHIPEPSTIPVLLNQMDPVFNDTATYNIPHNQTFSPYSDSARAMNEPNSDEQDAVQNFLRGAEEENARFENDAQFPDTNGQTTQSGTSIESTLLPALASTSTFPQSSEPNAHTSQDVSNQAQTAAQTGNETSSITESNANVSNGNSSLPTTAESTFEPESTVKPNPRSAKGGVDYQSLLDTISRSTSTAPAADPVSAPTAAASLVDQGSNPFPPIPGLPPKPPAQANPPESPTYYTYSNSRSDPREQYQTVNHDASKLNGTETTTSQPAIQGILTQAPGTWDQTASQVLPRNAEPSSASNLLQSSESSISTDLNERPWTPTTQALYDRFLEDERRYVTEGIWDKFPQGSRLFVGNLPSEKVTKRDLFHTFHKHGRLAQISIKQAYGFVQYLEASSCQAALHAEQGVEIRGRKIHLEISKPQKNTRSQGQGNKRRRSRSPDRGVTRQNDRYGRSNFSDFRDQPNRRDDYRPRRSPSPRSYRTRDDYRQIGQSPQFGSDGRPRSPYSSNFPPANLPGYDEEALLPLPRREPADVPDVQLLIIDPSVARSFINWIEQGFRSKGLRASTIWLSPRLPLSAVVKRQIIEGVQAVVKLTQSAQFNSKIPLQVFDRSTGASNVNFNEYVDLDIPVAADIVLHARQKERGTVQLSPQGFPPQGYPQTPFGHHPAPQFAPQLPPNFPQPQHNQFRYSQQSQYHSQVQTPLTPNSSAPNLQQLLANLRQPGESQNSTSTTSEKPAPDLAGILSNVARQQSQAGQFPQQSPPSQQPPSYGNAPAYGTGQQPQQNVQNIMETLARYNR
ncbi:uncharacterized protein Z518_04797 [Rhinocladiella mackenziei CBS 650.93]|uniref:RRM domain-containing protein n=1 Tax=Rhinocladiella mackenziei CBS 650.93 TaxID=1442369 RepID=A0A0D2IUI5_9EURO|nr:uncharacterized protein Z518_04797 [Rhinocladiella mackenziei CBS 650.93]KIX06821.1 hypothetical protein Z518_04797 [Rhinocladiella mackenziei CBS 650.93]